MGPKGVEVPWEKGDRVLAFDSIGWKMAGGDVGDNSQFWKPATILEIHPAHHLVDDTATLRWDGQVRGTSHGHLLSALKPLP